MSNRSDSELRTYAREPFFARVAQYVHHPWKDPRENRLSAILAALLERVPGLAERLIDRWLGMRLGGPLRVGFQEPVGVGTMDLTLQTGPEGRPDLLVWLEVKHGSKKSGDDQITKYNNALRRRAGAAKRLLVLASAEVQPEMYDAVWHDDPRAHEDDPLLVTWQEVSRVVQEMLGQDRSGVEQWLLTEFNTYLGGEGLADHRLDQDLVAALAATNALNSALAGVMQHADRLISEAWSS